MIAALKAYPVMKDSGVPWLGNVPDHWVTFRFKDLASLPIKNGVGEAAQTWRSDWPRYVRTTDILDRMTLRPNTLASLPPGLAEPAMLKVGDVLFSAAGSIGKVYWHARDIGPACFAGFLVRLRPKSGISQAFLSYWAESPPFHGQVTAGAVESTIQNFSAGKYRVLQVALPPTAEQSAIVRFLDHADLRIRRYIRAKQKLIKLLEEQKQAIIRRAVTRGLDPSVRLKPSGVEWLGEVPENWEVSRVKAEFHCLNRHRIPLSGTERGTMTARLYDYYGASGVIDKVDDYLFDDDLLLIAEDGANLVLRHLPLAIVAHGKFWVNNHAHILKPTRGNLEYLAGVMEHLNYMPWISGAAQPKLTQDRLMSIAIAVPPRDEQDRIVAAVLEETSPLSATIGRARTEIDFLREYRTRLIADVVTGKFDVREAVARLPDELEEPEALGEVDALIDAEEEGIDEPDALPEEAED